MGQRLNISIESNGEVLANSYYHWSAYTGSAIYLVQQIVDCFDEYRKLYPDELELAVELLQATGAGFNPEELVRITSPGHDPSYDKIKDLRASISRNDGLIAITPIGIKETERWEEGRVTIDLGTETIDFDVYWFETKTDFEREYKDVFEEGGYYHNLPSYNFDFPIVPVGEFWRIKEAYQHNPRGYYYGESFVFIWIE